MGSYEHKVPENNASIESFLFVGQKQYFATSTHTYHKSSLTSYCTGNNNVCLEYIVLAVYRLSESFSLMRVSPISMEMVSAKSMRRSQSHYQFNDMVTRSSAKLLPVA